MKIRPVGAHLFHADGRTDRHRYDEANSHFSQFCERAYKVNNKIQFSRLVGMTYILCS